MGTEKVDYEAKQLYQDERVAYVYNAQFRSPLRLANLRARLIDYGERRAFERLVSQTEPGGAVLDIACGTGRYTELLLQRGYKVGGIDIAPQMLAIARHQIGAHPALLFLQNGDAEHLPFQTAQFDGITCMRLYHRIPPSVRIEMLKETRRVAERWGVFFFGMSTPWLGTRRWVREHMLRRVSNPFPVSMTQMLAELRSAGWQAIRKAWVLPFLADGLLVLCTGRS